MALPFQQELLIKQLQEQHYEQYMAQVYAQQAQSQAEMLEGGANGANGSGPAANGHGHHSENNSDSEAGPKPADAYLQQGLERPAPKVGDEEDESDASETEIRHEVEQRECFVPAFRCPPPFLPTFRAVPTRTCTTLLHSMPSLASDSFLNFLNLSTLVPSVHGQMGLFCHCKQ